ncbi:MAG: hypothetical protein ABIY55_12095 [Kofleriaceae bacterium]
MQRAPRYKSTPSESLEKLLSPGILSFRRTDGAFYDARVEYRF